ERPGGRGSRREAERRDRDDAGGAQRGRRVWLRGGEPPLRPRLPRPRDPSTHLRRWRRRRRGDDDRLQERGGGAHAHPSGLRSEIVQTRGRARHLATVSEVASARAVEAMHYAATLRRGRHVMKLNTLFALAAVTGAAMACASGSGT